MRKCLTGEYDLKETDTTLISKIIVSSFSSVFWTDASSVSAITQGLRGICNLPAGQSSGLDGSHESALHWIGSLKENYLCQTKVTKQHMIVACRVVLEIPVQSSFLAPKKKTKTETTVFFSLWTGLGLNWAFHV